MAIVEVRTHAGEFDRRVGGGGLLTGGRLHLRQWQKAMGELDRLDVARRDDDAGAHLGHAVELRREAGREADATVRGRIARHDAQRAWRRPTR